MGRSVECAIVLMTRMAVLAHARILHAWIQGLITPEMQKPSNSQYNTVQYKKCDLSIRLNAAKITKIHRTTYRHIPPSCSHRNIIGPLLRTNHVFRTNPFVELL